MAFGRFCGEFISFSLVLSMIQIVYLTWTNCLFDSCVRFFLNFIKNVKKVEIISEATNSLKNPKNELNRFESSLISTSIFLSFR